MKNCISELWVCYKKVARLLRRMPRAEYHHLPGGHMFPLERPQATADLLRQLFSRWHVDQEQDA